MLELQLYVLLNFVEIFFEPTASSCFETYQKKVSHEGLLSFLNIFHDFVCSYINTVTFFPFFFERSIVCLVPLLLPSQIARTASQHSTICAFLIYPADFPKVQSAGYSSTGILLSIAQPISTK